MLDMNKFTNIIEEDFDAFDIEEAVKTMNILDHTWYSCIDEDGQPRSPTVSEVRKHLRKRIIEGYEYLIEHKVDRFVTSTAGFRVESNHNEEDGYWTVIMYCPVESIW